MNTLYDILKSYEGNPDDELECEKYPDRVVRLHIFITAITSGELTREEHNALAWITKEDIPNYQLCSADSKMLRSANISGTPSF